MDGHANLNYVAKMTVRILTCPRSPIPVLRKNTSFILLYRNTRD